MEIGSLQCSVMQIQFKTCLVGLYPDTVNIVEAQIKFWTDPVTQLSLDMLIKPEYEPIFIPSVEKKYIFITMKLKQ